MKEQVLPSATKENQYGVCFKTRDTTMKILIDVPKPWDPTDFHVFRQPHMRLSNCSFLPEMFHT